jgi:hypothetical protein
MNFSVGIKQLVFVDMELDVLVKYQQKQIMEYVELE